MSILENKESWAKKFSEGWLAKLRKTGTFYWNAYIFPENTTPVSGPGIDLKSSRLMLISSTGGYLFDSQQPFDASNPLGDYTVRKFPSSTPYENLAYAHEHYDHTAVNADPQVLLPLGHLREMVAENRIGSLTSVVSFMGYQPDISRLLDETIPAILKIIRDEQADAALLVPS
jgi:D-proline reductase (dithiol) PrdB